jgi:hypothetical protein
MGLAGLGNGGRGGISQHHRRIGFAVQRLSKCQRRGEISPPTSVLGLSGEGGGIISDLADAVRAARAAIEAQTSQYSH